MESDLTKKLSRSKAWELYTVIPNTELPRGLTNIALMLTEGYPYIDIRLIPSEDAMRDGVWETKEPSHFIYGKLGQKRLRERTQNPYTNLFCFLVECVERDENGERREGFSQIIPLPIYS
jgi:hypothetical protein